MTKAELQEENESLNLDAKLFKIELGNLSTKLKEQEVLADGYKTEADNSNAQLRTSWTMRDKLRGCLGSEQKAHTQTSKDLMQTITILTRLLSKEENEQ